MIFDLEQPVSLDDTGIYVGLEMNYFEVSFRYAKSRLNALRLLRETAMTYENAEQNF